MAPVLPNAIISAFTRPNPGHLSSGIGPLDATSSPDEVARALVQRCEAALRVIQAQALASDMPEEGWVLRRCEAHVWLQQRTRAFGRDEAVLLFAGVMIGICLYGLLMTLIGPQSEADGDEAETEEEGTILLRESQADYAPRPVNHAELNSAVIDEKRPLPAYTDDESGQPGALDGEGQGESGNGRQVIKPYNGLFTLMYGYGHI